MIGLSKLASSLMGATTYLRGLSCTPSSPASMVVNVARGEIYSVQNVENTAYSSLAADTINTILKQGIVMSATAFTLTAPTTAGQSINYLIQVTYSDTDSGATVLPYYNAANPSVAYSGPNNSGAAQNTVRSGVCTVALKAGVAATTGTQTTPSVDTGYTAAWVITVAQGATAITAANISTAANAPFLPVGGLVAAIQQSTMTYATDTGAANAYAAQFIPALPTLIDGMRLTFKAKVANTGASTFSANGGTAYPLYSGANQALQGGEIVAGGLVEVKWNSTLTGWNLCCSAGGSLPVGTATQPNHAMQFGQAVGRLVGPPQVFTSSGTYTPTPGAKSIIVEAVGGGGAGGGATAGSSTSNSVGGGGGSGAYAMILISSGFSSVPFAIGTAGQGVVGSTGGNGGSTIFGTFLTCLGGNGGATGTASNAAALGGGAFGVSEPTVSGATALASMGGAAATTGYMLTPQGGNAGGGANSPFGVGARGAGLGIGNDATGRGAGGGGALNVASTSSAQRGGNGTAGYIRVWEYA